MSGERILIDTNVAIHFLSGKLPSFHTALLFNTRIHLSFIAEIELRSFRGNDQKHIVAINDLLPECVVHGIDPEVKEETIRLRITHGLKTPDAIIAATANVFRLPLMTGDKGLKRLDKELELLFVKYE